VVAQALTLYAKLSGSPRATATTADSAIGIPAVLPMASRERQS
jgi:hypothetical protein